MNHQLASASVLPSNCPSALSLHQTTPFAAAVLQERSTNRQNDRVRNGAATWSNGVHDYSIDKLGDDGDDFLHKMYAQNFPNKRPPMSDADLDRKARDLQKAFEACPGYRKYREKTKESDKLEAAGKNYKKWPDEMEFAFFKALIIYPPVGRRQLNCPSGKVRRGRNEVIADAIQRWTGEICKRKQVSSHIQVLKLKVAHDPKILQILGGSKGDNRRRYRYQQLQYGQLASPESPRALRSANYTPSSAFTSPSKSLHYSTGKMRISFVPEHFQMYVQVPNRRLHTFTSFGHHPQQSTLNVPQNTPVDSGSWAPLGHALQSSEPPTCQVLYCDASLSAINTTLPMGAEFAIEFSIYADHPWLISGGYRQFECKTSFYENGTFLQSFDKTDLVYHEQERLLKCIPLGSSFWVSHPSVNGLTARRANVALEGKNGEDKSGNSPFVLSGISAVQKFTASTVNPYSGRGNQEKESMLVIFWRFRSTQAGETGETTWRDVEFVGAKNEFADDSMSQGDELEYEQDDLQMRTQNSMMTQFSPTGFDMFSQPSHQAFDPSSHSYGTDHSVSMRSLPTGITSAFAQIPVHDLPTPAMEMPDPSVHGMGMDSFGNDHSFGQSTMDGQVSSFASTHHGSHIGLGLENLSHHPGPSLFGQHDTQVDSQRVAEATGGASMSMSGEMPSTSIFDTHQNDQASMHSWATTAGNLFDLPQSWHDDPFPATGHNIYEEPISDLTIKMDQQQAHSTLKNSATHGAIHGTTNDNLDDPFVTAAGDVSLGLISLVKPSETELDRVVELGLEMIKEANKEHLQQQHQQQAKLEDLPPAVQASNIEHDSVPGAEDDEYELEGDRCASLAAGEALQRALGLTREEVSSTGAAGSI